MKEIMKKNEKLMTTKEVAKALNCSVSTVRENGKKCFPNKKIENGKTILWNEKEVTVLLEKIKSNNSNQHNLTSSLLGTQTELSNAMKIEMLNAQIKAILQDELNKVKQQNENLKIELSQSKEWYSVKRVLIETGREYSYKPLKKYSIENGYKIEKVFDKNYEHVNAYHIDVWNAVYNLEL